MSLFTTQECRAFSLLKAVDSLAQCGELQRGSLEAEMLTEVRERAGIEPRSATNIHVPWELLVGHRTLDATTSDGAFVVGAQTRAPVAALRAHSVVAELGCSIIGGLRSDQRAPAFGEIQPASWLAGEYDPIESIQPTIEQISATPKRVGTIAKYSRGFAAQSPQGTKALESYLTAVIGQALDVAVLQGTGTAGQPLGLLHLPGVTTGAIEAAATWQQWVALETELEKHSGGLRASSLTPMSKGCCVSGQSIRPMALQFGTRPPLPGFAPSPAPPRLPDFCSRAIGRDARFTLGDQGSRSPSIRVHISAPALF